MMFPLSPYSFSVYTFTQAYHAFRITYKSGSRIASPSAPQQKTEKTEQIKCSSSHSHAQPSGERASECSRA